MAGQYSRLIQSMVALQDSLNLTETGGFNPSVDVFEIPGEYVIAVAMAGVRPTDVRLRLDQGLLTIAGCRHELMPGKSKKYHQLDITKGEFKKTLKLPANLAMNQISAYFELGILMIRILKDKKRREKTRVIRFAVK